MKTAEKIIRGNYQHAKSKIFIQGFAYLQAKAIK